MDECHNAAQFDLNHGVYLFEVPASTESVIF